MSRSYRKPYAAISGAKSAHEDKKAAARGLRRRHNQWLKTLDDVEEACPPHRLECAHNNICEWIRDGRQRLFCMDSRRPEHFDWMFRYWLRLQRK